MEQQEIFGFIGGFLINIAFVPQVYRLFRLRSAREISLPFTAILVFGGAFWLTYGLVISSPSIIISNIVALILSLLMLFAKIRWGKVPVNEKHS